VRRFRTGHQGRPVERPSIDRLTRGAAEAC
jgi:hypothetical protein